MKKFVALFLIVAALLTLAACGSKDALAGTWSAELGADGYKLYRLPVENHFTFFRHV